MEKTIKKDWGEEHWIKVTDRYVMKKLDIRAGEAISLQYHQKKEETWYVAEGHGLAQVGEEVFPVKKGDTVHLPPGTLHQLRALDTLSVIESSTPELEDIVRLKG